jgi:hypothetical protein
MRDLGISYPVALDNEYAIWREFNNQYWPAHYFIDAFGHIRAHHFGKGDYAGSEEIIRQLLIESGSKVLPQATAGATSATGVEIAADNMHMRSPETYVGYEHHPAACAGDHCLPISGKGSAPGTRARSEPKTHSLPSDA